MKRRPRIFMRLAENQRCEGKLTVNEYEMILITWKCIGG